MGKFYDHIPDGLMDFLRRSKMFYVATAPLEGGSVNVSPKANEGTLEIVDSHRVRYIDLTGSGIETISHLLQPKNGRITLMFANIEEGAPNIVRLFGKGSVRERGEDEGFDARWREQNDGKPVPIGGRAIIDVAVHTCSTSCGYSLPVYRFERKRTVLDDFHAKYEKLGVEAMLKYKKYEFKDGGAGVLQQYVGHDGEKMKEERRRTIESALEAYWAICNTLSIDGLPGLRSVRGMTDEKEKRRLLEQAKEHDQLQAPKDDLGPLRSDLVLQSASAKSDSKAQTAHMAAVNYSHIVLAFSIGAALSAAILLASR